MEVDQSNEKQESELIQNFNTHAIFLGQLVIFWLDYFEAYKKSFEQSNTFGVS